MNDKGMDRDVALALAAELSSISAAVAQINDNEFVPHIVTQPTDQEVAVGGTCTFTVVANNVKAYQWQVKTSSTADWKNSLFSGNKTDTLAFPTQSSHYGYQYRCEITGKDNSVIYTNEVQPILPET